MLTLKKQKWISQHLFTGRVPVTIFLLGAFFVSTFVSEFSAIAMLFGLCLSTLLIGARMLLCPTAKQD